MLRSELAKRLKWAVLESERRSRPVSTELIELSIHGVRLSSGLQNEPIVVKVANLGHQPNVENSYPTSQ